MAGLARALQWISLLILLHAAYSTFDYLSQLKAVDRPQDHIPKDVTLEALLSLFLFVLGTVLASPTLAEITWAKEMDKRSIDEMDSRIGFMDLKHRGAVFFGSQ
ncbi:SubName: Full=Uncharacterized protein {ECO:0000313/EMBL:CCA71868.1} [Serendipita indica DSM 11827]|uniref:Uncharacterized protein n=1 Tax=Serendipita indica (strain DSM 11827) TaxID=1109443 RepID=G4TKM5_SERID|nr:SubName: Full=Uncharacterized protein {ECO:0000313/EMBL:CCA71868.1} [Serendipita indica DSM 11827]CCA71868.1 hypothetical protein PIIN_05803 [Serendipita indica DSM 11827]